MMNAIENWNHLVWVILKVGFLYYHWNHSLQYFTLIFCVSLGLCYSFMFWHSSGVSKLYLTTQNCHPMWDFKQWFIKGWCYCLERFLNGFQYFSFCLYITCTCTILCISPLSFTLISPLNFSMIFSLTFSFAWTLLVIK